MQGGCSKTTERVLSSKEDEVKGRAPWRVSLSLPLQRVRLSAFCKRSWLCNALYIARLDLFWFLNGKAILFLKWVPAGMLEKRRDASSIPHWHRSTQSTADQELVREEWGPNLEPMQGERSSLSFFSKWMGRGRRVVWAVMSFLTGSSQSWEVKLQGKPAVSEWLSALTGDSKWLRVPTMVINFLSYAELFCYFGSSRGHLFSFSLSLSLYVLRVWLSLLPLVC